MTAKEAVKIAMKDPEFKKRYDGCRYSKMWTTILFSIGDESFYVSNNATMHEDTGEIKIHMTSGKHAASRAAYLIRSGATFEIAPEVAGR